MNLQESLPSHSVDRAYDRVSVYDLEVVEQDAIDKEHYFTLSKEGVTIYKDKGSQFTTMQQWDREFKLFNKISDIRFFSQYRRWKAFRTWKQGLRQGKMGLSSDALGDNLFVLCKPLREALLTVRATSMPMATMGMLDMPPGMIFDLDNFEAMQNAVADDLRTKLEGLSATVLTSVRTACDEVVDQFLKSNNISANHKMTFMERAALRAECKRLTRFLRMVDIMMNDFLVSMVKEALDKLVKATECPSLEAKIETEDTITLIDMATKRKELKWKTPLFRVSANFKKELPPGSTLGAISTDPGDDPKSKSKDAGDDQGISKSKSKSRDVEDEGAGEESPQEALEAMILEPTQDSINRVIDGVISNALDVVCSFVKVLQCKETEMYVMPEGEDENEEENEGADLATTIRGLPFYTRGKDQIHRYLRHNFSAIDNYQNVFDPFRRIYFKNQAYVNDVSDLFSNGEVEAFGKAIAFYKGQIEKFTEVPRYADVGSILVDTSVMKEEMTPSPVSCINAIKEWLPTLAGQRAGALLEEVGGMNPIIGGDPSTVEAYVNKKKVKDTASANLESYKDTQTYALSLLFLMDDNKWPVPDSVKATTRMLKEALEKMEVYIGDAESKEEDEGKGLQLR